MLNTSKVREALERMDTIPIHPLDTRSPAEIAASLSAQMIGILRVCKRLDDNFPHSEPLLTEQARAVLAHIEQRSL